MSIDQSNCESRLEPERAESIGETARVNSGIQIINEKLLNPEFRDALLGMAAAKPYPNEQSVITAFFKKHQEYALEFASPAYNFKTQYIDRMPRVDAAAATTEVLRKSRREKLSQSGQMMERGSGFMERM